MCLILLANRVILYKRCLIGGSMPENTDIRSFFDIPIEHFPDKSARWLLQDKENVQGLLEIVAIELVDLIDFNQLSQLNRSFIADNL